MVQPVLLYLEFLYPVILYLAVLLEFVGFPAGFLS